VDEEKGDRETLIRHLIDGEYEHVVRIVAFNTAQGWSRDVSTEIAREVVERARAQGEDLTGPVRRFVDWELERAERQRASSFMGHRNVREPERNGCEPKAQRQVDFAAAVVCLCG
jgi:hypothetical protein